MIRDLTHMTEIVNTPRKFRITKPTDVQNRCIYLLFPAILIKSCQTYIHHHWKSQEEAEGTDTETKQDFSLCSIDKCFKFIHKSGDDCLHQ